MEKVKATLAHLAACTGIAGCALVEHSSGMVWWYESDRPDMEQVAEAAVEFFRSPDRLKLELNQLGTLQSAAYSFEQFVISLHPCKSTHGLVLVCLAHKHTIKWALVSPAIQAVLKVLQSAKQ